MSRPYKRRYCEARTKGDQCGTSGVGAPIQGHRLCAAHKAAHQCGHEVIIHETGMTITGLVVEKKPPALPKRCERCGKNIPEDYARNKTVKYCSATCRNRVNHQNAGQRMLGPKPPSQKQQEALDAYERLGTFELVAKELGISASSARQRINEGLERLRDARSLGR